MLVTVGFLEIPDTQGEIERPGCSLKWKHSPPPLGTETSGLKKQPWSLRSLQYNFSAHPRLENFSSLNEDFFFFPELAANKKRETAPLL